jgi:hypothetical protein
MRQRPTCTYPLRVLSSSTFAQLAAPRSLQALVFKTGSRITGHFLRTRVPGKRPKRSPKEAQSARHGHQMNVAQFIEWLKTKDQTANVVLMGQRECGSPCGCVETGDCWSFEPAYTKVGQYRDGAPYLCLSVMTHKVPRL